VIEKRIAPLNSPSFFTSYMCRTKVFVHFEFFMIFTDENFSKCQTVKIKKNSNL
jgi:hypothetical protein